MKVEVTKLEWVALALVVIAQLTWSKHPPILSLQAVPVLVAGLALWGAHRLRPTALTSRPGLAAHALETVAGLLLISAVLCADQTFGFVAQVTAACLVARAAIDVPPERRAVDVAALWRGWPTRTLTVLLALGGLALGSGWRGSSYSTRMYDTGDYTSIISTTVPGADAWGTGDGTALGVLLALPVVGLVVTAWRSGLVGRTLLLAGPALAVLLSSWLAVVDRKRVADLTGYASFKPQEAAGPPVMAMLMVLAVAAAGWLIVADQRRTRKPSRS